MGNDRHLLAPIQSALLGYLSASPRSGFSSTQAYDLVGYAGYEILLGDRLVGGNSVPVAFLTYNRQVLNCAEMTYGPTTAPFPSMLALVPCGILTRFTSTPISFVNGNLGPFSELLYCTQGALGTPEQYYIQPYNTLYLHQTALLLHRTL